MEKKWKYIYILVYIYFLFFFILFLFFFTPIISIYPEIQLAVLKRVFENIPLCTMDGSIFFTPQKKRLMLITGCYEEEGRNNRPTLIKTLDY